MKKIVLFVFLGILFGYKDKKYYDYPCYCMIDVMSMNLNVLDKDTREDLIGYGKTYHPDCVRLYALFGNRHFYRFIKESIYPYYTIGEFGFQNSNFLFKLSSIEQDT